MTPSATIKIAVQRSGRLSEGSIDLLRQMGLIFECSKDALFATCRNLPIDILFLRDDDIPEYVQDSVADLGIVGRNVLLERPAKVEEIEELDFGFCTLNIAVPEQKDYTKISDLAGGRIATTYPRILKNYLRQNTVSAEIIYLRGCSELAPALRIADAVCDLVSTGSTLRTNRLRVIDEVCSSQAILIGCRRLKRNKQLLLQTILRRARGVLKAKRYKYIMFNLLKDRIRDASKLVPGSKSPTVMTLADPRFVAIHSVVLEDKFWETVEYIKKIGGTDILVTPIEKFIS